MKNIKVAVNLLALFVLVIGEDIWSGELPKSEIDTNSDHNGNYSSYPSASYNGGNLTDGNDTTQIQIPRRRVYTSYQLWLIGHLKRQIEFEYILRGVSLSFAFISLILLSSLKVKSSLKFFIHRQMLTAYCIADSLFLLTHQDVQMAAVKVKTVCTAMTILSHYFMTAFLTCMLIEGVHICVKLTAVFDTESKVKQYMLYGSIGWGLPLLIITIELIGWFDRFASLETCSLLNKKADQWLYKGPVAAILLANFACFLFILGVVIREIITSKRYTSGLKKTAGTIRSMLVIYPLLGITFLMGFFLEFDDVILGYVFVIFNGIIGILFFVFHVVFDEQVRKAFLKDVCGKKNAVHSTGTIRSVRSSYSPPLGEDRRQSNFDGISQRDLYTGSSNFGLSPNSCRKIQLTVRQTDSTELEDLGVRNCATDNSSLSSN